MIRVTATYAAGEPMTPTDFANFFQTYGWLGITIVLVMGGIAKWYVWRWQYEEKVEGEKFWRDRYFAREETMDKALSTLSDTVDLLKNEKSIHATNNTHVR